MTPSHGGSSPDRKAIRDAQQRVYDQEAFVRRMILNGAHSQAAEDRLCELEKALSLLKQQR